MRSIVLSISENFVNEKIIENVDDIFYLYYNEIEDVINSKNVDLKSIISSRKNEYKMYEMLPSYTRIIFSSKVFDKKHENINNDVIKVNNDELIGIACSSGIVQGQVVVINSNNIQDVDVKGKNNSYKDDRSRMDIFNCQGYRINFRERIITFT